MVTKQLQAPGKESKFDQPLQAKGVAP